MASEATTALTLALARPILHRAGRLSRWGKPSRVVPPVEIPAEAPGWLPVSLAALRAARTAMQVSRALNSHNEPRCRPMRRRPWGRALFASAAVAAILIAHTTP